MKDHAGSTENNGSLTNEEPTLPALKAFTLIEMLVAMAVLAMLMTFMFSMVGGTTRLWEQGAAKMEAAQAARIGLEQIAEDLESAISLQTNSVDPNQVSIIPFLAGNQSADNWGRGNANLEIAAGSDQVAGFLVTGDPTAPFSEFGYFCAFTSQDKGYYSLSTGKRYYLVQHKITSKKSTLIIPKSPTNWKPNVADYKDSGTPLATFTTPAIDNCIRLEIQYADTNGGTLTWASTWNSQTNLPAGALVTVIVMDSRTAERVAQLTNQATLNADDIKSVTNSMTPLPGIQTLLRNGSVVMRRFIPFRGANYQ